MVGIFPKDTHIHFVNANYIVSDSPYDDVIIIVMRHAGKPNRDEVRSILTKLGMRLVGRSGFVGETNELWFHEVECITHGETDNNTSQWTR